MIRILKAADLVVDLSTGSTLYIYGEGLTEVLAGGTRVLQVKANEEQLRRCFPTEEVRQRTAKGAERLERATEIRLVSKAGTDLKMRKQGRKGLTQFGISDENGRWDSWPSGFLYCAPEEETANGTLVLDVGDLLVMLGRYVAEPVRINVENGTIKSIDGGVDAVFLEERMDQAKDPEAYIISHIGWGTDNRARWSEIAQRGTEDGCARSPIDLWQRSNRVWRQLSPGRQEPHHGARRSDLAPGQFELDGKPSSTMDESFLKICGK